MTFPSSMVSPFSNVLKVDSLAVTLANFLFTYGTTPAVSGTIGITATNAILFPTIGFLNVHLGDLTGSYTFHSPSILNLTVPQLDIPLGDALTIHLGQVNLTPSEQVIATIDNNATVSSNLIAGLPSIHLRGFQLTRDGFSLGSVLLTNAAVETFTVNSTTTSYQLTQNPTNLALISVSVTVGTTTTTLKPGIDFLVASIDDPAHPGAKAAKLTFLSPLTQGSVQVTYPITTITIGNFLSFDYASVELTDFTVNRNIRQWSVDR